MLTQQVKEQGEEIKEKNRQLDEARELVQATMAAAEQQLKGFAIPYADITEWGEKLGDGSFGTVFKGVLRGTIGVAIKTMRVAKITVDALEKFKAEIIVSVCK